MRILLLTIVTLLSACGLFKAPEAVTIVDGIRVEYALSSTPAPVVGYAYYLGTKCKIVIDPGFFNKKSPEFVLVLAHEFGHCQDFFKLDFSHNSFGNQGCVWDKHFCRPSEGFAQAYALAYIDKCGTNANIFNFPGWPTVDAPPCDVPDPRTIRPEDYNGESF